jgi:hypothetical protein
MEVDMKRGLFIFVSLATVALMCSACMEETTPEPLIESEPTSPVQEKMEPTGEPGPEKVVLGMQEDAFCYNGPGEFYDVEGMLAPGQHFEALGINAAANWFEIDPTAIINPEPPGRPINEMIDPESPHSPRCWVPAGSVETRGDVSRLPVVLSPRLGVVAETGCFSGPGNYYRLNGMLKPDQFFDILGVDHEIPGTDEGGAEIDDDVTWFQIDPTAVVDPTPPLSPLNESFGECTSYAQAVPRCWVPGASVVTSGSLATLPVIEIPKLGVIEQSECYAGPNEKLKLVSSLIPEQYFRIIAIDRQVEKEGSGNAGIDDDITWFEIDPTAIIDPTPPSSNTELSPQPDPPGSQFHTHCWVKGTGVETSGDLSNLPVALVPRMAVFEDTACHAGPKNAFMSTGLLNSGSMVEILGVDAPVNWIDDDVTWAENGWNQIDDDVTWLQIDPAALIDPTPPHSPINRIMDPDSPHSPRCWVPINRVAACGNLTLLPVVTVRTITLPTETPSSQGGKKPSCSSYTTQTECNAHSNDGCSWNANLSKCIKN